MDYAQARIIVGVGGSSLAVSALRGASRIAAAMDAQISAIMIWEYPARFYATPGLSPKSDAQSALADALTQAFGPDLPVSLDSAVLHGPAARVLVEQSETADLVVLGSRGQGGFARLLLGSVSTAVSQHAQCPVLITHNCENSKITGKALADAADS